MSTVLRVSRGSKAVRHGVQHINQTYRIKEYSRHTASYSYSVADDGEIPEITTDTNYGITPDYGDGIIGQNTVGSITKGATGGFAEFINGYYENIGTDVWTYDTYSYRGGEYIINLRSFNPTMGYSSPLETPMNRPFVHVKAIVSDDEAVEVTPSGIVTLAYDSNGNALYYAGNAVTKFRVTFLCDVYTFYDNDGNVVSWETDNYTVDSVSATKDYAPRYSYTVVNNYRSLDFPHKYKVTETEV
jgi:hypothetical protein